MKFADFDRHTFSKRFPNRGDDPHGLGALMEGMFDEPTPDPNEQTLAQIVAHPALDLVTTTCSEHVVYGCPICKEVFFDKNDAERCGNRERAFANKFAGMSVGDWLKYEVVTPNKVDCWTDTQVGDHAFVQITKFGYGYNGYRCGRILTIHYEGGYINGETMERWSPSSESERDAYKRRDLQTAIDKLPASE